jgi:putative tricarboxylic transport membrane protein
MDGVSQFVSAVLAIGASPQVLYVFGATFLGIVVGMIPGLTATLGVALVATLTFTMAQDVAILVLVCVYIGAIYGGSRSAILLNIPGTPANAATALDGHQLAVKGKAGDAMVIATTGSFLGTLVGMIGLAMIAPLLAEFALEFTSFEFFWLAIFGIVICGQLTAMGDPLKGWIAGFFGLAIAMVGQESIHAYSRYTYGWQDLEGGLGLLPVLVGAFGCAEVLSVMRHRASEMVEHVARTSRASFFAFTRYTRTWLRSGFIGTFMGVVPGVGEDMGAWVSLAATRRAAKNPDEIGKGSVEGLLAAETGNNAAVPGAFVPVLTLAIPGSAPAAVLLAAMVIHGLRPGPLIMITQPDFFYSIVAMVFWASLAMLVLGLLMTRPLLMILKVRREWLMGVIFVLCVVGAFAIASRPFDVGVMICFGILGFLMRETGFPVAPMILGVVLGPILDSNLRRSLALSQGDPIDFVTRPISAVIAGLILLSILLAMPWVRRGIANAHRQIFNRSGRVSE